MIRTSMIRGQDHGGSTINSITGRKSICQSISSIIDPASINEYFGEINTDPNYSPP